MSSADHTITATGWRGYFQWLKQDQPALYAYVAPRIAASIPEVYSDHSQTQSMNALSGCACTGFGALYADKPYHARRHIEGLGVTYENSFAPEPGGGADDLVPTLSASDIESADITTGTSSSDLAFDATSSLVSSVPDIDLSSVANTGTSDPSTTSAVTTAVVNGINALSAADVQNNAASQAIANTNYAQLLQASAGNTPLNLSTSALGTLGAALGSNTNVVLIGGGLLLLLAVAATMQD